LQKNRSIPSWTIINSLKDNKRSEEYLSLKIVTNHKKVKNIKNIQIKYIKINIVKRLTSKTS
jgi:hypothetical protein